MANTLQEIVTKRNDIIFNTIGGEDGKAQLHALHPEEFEYYALALELLDSNNETEMFLLFPVMPSSITEDERSINNIQKTLGGVVVNNNNTFVPFDIVLNGTFGKKFRLASGLKDTIDSSSQPDYFGTGIYLPGKTLQNITVTNVKNKAFSETIKTGYGLQKILRKMYRASFKLDAVGGSRKLLYYNLALNSSYVVEPLNFNSFMNKDNNMMWQYVLNLKAIAPINRLSSYYKGRLQDITQQNYMNKNANYNGRKIDNILTDQLRSNTVAVVDRAKVNNILVSAARQGQEAILNRISTNLNKLNG
jgi:hypothetical protein